MSNSKYIVKDGKVQLNPAFGSPDKPSTVANPQKALVATTNLDDANAVSDLTGQPLASSTLGMAVAVQDATYIGQFHSGGRVEGGELLEKISQVFSEMEMPIGLASKLIALQGYAINIKLDDSGSMGTRSANGYSRWQNLAQRLVQLMKLLQVVPTGDVTFSFLDRPDVYLIQRRGLTPEQFFGRAQQVIQQAFASPPRGGTPIYANVVQMLNSSRGPTAHYLFTDGVPSGSGYSPEQEIKLTQDALLGRYNPQQTPFTIGCCSDNPTDTMWIHEVEEEACRPGAPGFVAALQNFRAEQLEVLNDQGPAFPYSEPMWLLCTLTAAMNPNDLDALDQHAPLSKPTLDNILGHVTTLQSYNSYWDSHPNATWLFTEDYQALLTADIASRVPAVNAFDSWLAQQLKRDIDMGDDTSEFRALAQVEQAVLSQFNRRRPQNVYNGRMDYWNNHCLQMELEQARYFLQQGAVQARQPLWSDYLARSGLVQSWVAFVQQCAAMRGGSAVAIQPSGQAPPPPYSVATGQQQQQQQQQGQTIGGDDYANPAYYNRSVPRGTAQTYSSPAQWTAVPAPASCCCAIA